MNLITFWIVQGYFLFTYIIEGYTLCLGHTSKMILVKNHMFVYKLKLFHYCQKNEIYFCCFSKTLEIYVSSGYQISLSSIY